MLDGFFPFDPYHLPLSKRWLGGDYREWTGVPGLDEEGSEGSDASEGSDEEEEEDGKELESDAS